MFGGFVGGGVVAGEIRGIVGGGVVAERMTLRRIGMNLIFNFCGSVLVSAAGEDRLIVGGRGGMHC